MTVPAKLNFNSPGYTYDSKPNHCMSTDLYPCCTHDCEWCVFYDKNSFLLAEWKEEKKKVCRTIMPADGFQDYCKGNILKYIWRWRDKAGVEDLKKARVYLNWLIESAEKKRGESK